MCGIAGWVSYDGNLKAHEDVITTMTKTMARWRDRWEQPARFPNVLALNVRARSVPG
jgi:hypothetical protein